MNAYKRNNGLNMNASEYEWIEQLSAKNLSSSSLVLITKFARHVRRLNGRILVLRDPLLFRNMAEEVIMTRDEVLETLFNKLMVDIKSVALKAGLDVPKEVFSESRSEQFSNLSYRGSQVK